jgi:S1-C subfamily serine protease
VGDIILKINGTAVNSTPALQEQVARNRPGDKITVTYLRDGRLKDVSVTLKNKNGGTNFVKTEKGSALGADFEVLSKEEKAKLKLVNGIKVTKIEGGRLRSYGIKEGFVITEVNGKPVNTIGELQDAFDNAKGRVMIRGVYPDGTKAYYSF